MKSQLHRENRAQKQGLIRQLGWVPLTFFLASTIISFMGCSSASPFLFSRLSGVEEYKQRHEDNIHEFMARQPPSNDILIRRQWNIDKERYGDWLAEEQRRMQAKQDRVTEIVERQERFFREYLRASRAASVNQ